MTTPNLGLTELANGQANYLNANEAFAVIDALLQTPVISKTLTAAPSTPANGDLYIMATAWSGVDGAAAGSLALYRTGAGWMVITPKEGWKFEVAADEITYRYDGGDWLAFGGASMVNPMTTEGDLIVGGGSGSPERLAAGVNGQRLTMVSGAPAWAYDLGATITESTTARNAALTDVGNYLRHTNASASTLTIPPQSSVAWPADAEIHVRRAAAGNLTLTPGSGVTLNAPSGGTLVMTNAMTVTLKRVAADVWDVIGQTVAA